MRVVEAHRRAFHREFCPSDSDAPKTEISGLQPATRFSSGGLQPMPVRKDKT